MTNARVDAECRGGEEAEDQFAMLRLHIAELAANDEVLVGQFADALADATGKTHAVLEPSAPFVITFVRPGRPELLDPRLVVGEQFDPVEAGLMGAAATCLRPSATS